MKDRLVFVIVFFFILGSVAISSMDGLSYTFKTVFNSIAMIVLVIIGLVFLYKYFRSNRK